MRFLWRQSASPLDYCAPQYYDGPNLATQSYIVPSVDTWSTLLGAHSLVVGFGIANATNYMTVSQVESTWQAVAQIIYSERTKPILDKAPLATDSQAESVVMVAVRKASCSPVLALTKGWSAELAMADRRRLTI